jgi:hypothetical protein
MEPATARLKRLLKKSPKQISRGLKSARDDKKKELATAQVKLRPFTTFPRLHSARPKPLLFVTRAEARLQGE